MVEKNRFDVIVIGLGAHGSACFFQAAKSGMKVLGIDRFTPPHKEGSTHGETRITRQAIGEGAWYTPMVLRSQEIWSEIEAATEETLFTNCGCLIMAPRSSEFFRETLNAATDYHINHQKLSVSQLAGKFPQFHPSAGTGVYFEPDSGFLDPWACIRGQLHLGRMNGGRIHNRERVLSYRQPPDSNSVTVQTDKDTYETDKLILCAGPWISELAGIPANTVFKVYRQVLSWYRIDGDKRDFFRDSFPCFIYEEEHETTSKSFYGFPALSPQADEIKIATESYIDPVSFEKVNRSISKEEENSLYTQFKDLLPRISSRCTRSSTCLYTATESHNFVIDQHPGHSHVYVVSPCSGHGFKHSAAIGESVVEMICGNTMHCDLSPFALNTSDAEKFNTVSYH